MASLPATNSQPHSQPRALVNYNRVKSMVQTPETIDRFGQVLGPDGARAFLASILNAVATNDKLAECEPASIIQAAMMAALLKLPIAKDLGYAWIIPYKGIATFQIGARGYTQLAQRTKEYLKINVASIYEGEMVVVNKVTGDVQVTGAPTSDKPIGFISYFKLKSGYEHWMYWTVEQMTAHAKRYSKSYKIPDSLWHTEFEKMACKTLLAYNLRKNGILSVEMRDVMEKDDDGGALGDFFRARGDGMGEEPGMGDTIDGQFSEAPSSDPIDPVKALVGGGICDNEHAAKGLLKRIPNDVQADEERLLIWGRMYRERRNAGDGVDEAATFAATMTDLSGEGQGQ